jgi:hypothetical protein
LSPVSGLSLKANVERVGRQLAQAERKSGRIRHGATSPASSNSRSGRSNFGCCRTPAAPASTTRPSAALPPPSVVNPDRSWPCRRHSEKGQRHKGREADAQLKRGFLSSAAKQENGSSACCRAPLGPAPATGRPRSRLRCGWQARAAGRRCGTAADGTRVLPQ